MKNFESWCKETSKEYLLVEWNYSKNENKTPNMFAPKSSKKVWWKCSKEHEWEATINHRINGTNCPVCSGRKILIGYNDLASQNISVAQEWNYERNDAITPQMVTCNSNKSVWWRCKKCNHEWKSSICDRNRGQGCPKCAYVLRGEKRSKVKGGESLADKFPELVKEWDYEKNGNLTPNVLFPASNKKVWWKCSKNHSWFASINNRTNLGNGCPYCTNHKVWKGFNDLQTLFGDIAQEWNYEKNGDITPSDVMAGSNTKFWWKCEQGHEWETTVNHRTLGNGCPICAGKKVLPGFNDLATLFPQLLCEWDYEKNKINPSMIMPGSNKRIWWKCERGHEWQTTLHNRTSLKRGCPKCAKELSTSFPEQALFYYINQVFSDALNGNKEVLKGYELDIYIPSKSVAIEYDGVAWHKDNKAVEREIHKNKICSENEITLIRIREDGLKEYSDCYCIMRNNNSSEEELEHIIQKILKILGIESINVNLDRDRSEIQNAYIHGARKTNFSRLFPELAKTWNYSKNGLLMPEMFSPHSNKRVWWVCEKGHEWCVAINNRVKTSYCPKCNGIRRRNTKRVVIPGYNDVRTVFSGLMIEWNYEKNVGILPEELIYTSTEKVWWVCEKGHEWYAKRY